MPPPPAPEVELAILAEARNEVGAADHKASMVLAVLGIGFGALLGGLLARDWSPRDLDGVGAVFWWMAAALASASVAAAALAVWPRFRVPEQTKQIFYWGHAAAFESQRSLDAVLDRHPPKLEDRTRHQMFELSKIVAKKYWYVRLAMSLAAVSAPLFLLASLLG